MGTEHQRRSIVVSAMGLGLLLAAGVAMARPTEEQIAKLGGPELTPMGGERAGNAEGTIPEWTGGITEPPPEWKPGDPRIDMFADDKILFTIDASNVDQYADKLSPGQIALIKSYEGYKMNVYPTRRSCANPPYVYDMVKNNARISRVDEECLVLNGMGVALFPIPETGCHLIQNGRLGVYNGLQGFDRLMVTLMPTKSGSYEPHRTRQITYHPTMVPEKYPNIESLGGVWVKTLAHNLAPAKTAGEITLVHPLVDGHNRTWTYNPGMRRVRRNPNFEYDNPAPGWEGLVTIDQINGFVGAADRYDWKMIGKQELYIPYNSHKLFDHRLKYDDKIQPRYPRRDLIRYELHRVWVLEATVRPDKRHTMPRRIFYLDEDTWLPVLVDAYDSRGQLWRVQESVPQLLYEIPTCMNQTTIYYDLVAGRYVMTPNMNEEPEADYLAVSKGLIANKGFTPDDIRRMGRR